MSATLPTPTLGLAQQLVQRESITPADAGCQELILSRLTALGFRGEFINRGGVTNLWAVRGDEKAKPLLVFAGHTDVVPPGPLDKWQYPPFAGVIKGGFLHGRGAADMKGSVASFVVACENFLSSHREVNGALGFLITSDEEGEAQFGTRAVVEELQSRGVQIDLCIVGEPSSDKKLGDTIKIGRRGSLSAKLQIFGRQQHIAYASENPIHEAAAVVAELSALVWDDGDDVFPPTTFNVSNFNAGTGADNVIPGAVVIEFNLRFSPNTSDAQIRARLEKVIKQHTNNFKIDWRLGGVPFITRARELVDAVSLSIKEITATTTQAATSGGTSDGRFLSPAGAQVVELGPLNATIHQINERVSIAELEQLTQIYQRILEKILTP